MKINIEKFYNKGFKEIYMSIDEYDEVKIILIDEFDNIYQNNSDYVYLCSDHSLELDGFLKNNKKENE